MAKKTNTITNTHSQSKEICEKFVTNYKYNHGLVSLLRILPQNKGNTILT